MEIKAKHIVGGVLLAFSLYGLHRYYLKNKVAKVISKNGITKKEIDTGINKVTENTPTSSFVQPSVPEQNIIIDTPVAPAPAPMQDEASRVADEALKKYEDDREAGMANAARGFLEKNAYDMSSLTGLSNRDIINTAISWGWKS